MNISKNKSKGFVSIFVVIFTAILVAIVTISFIRLMLNDEQQATENDLSQSAFDSAQAGVEDAKVALLHYLSACNNGNTSTCSDLKAKIDAAQCNTLINGSSEEIAIQTGESNDLEQAYTCVKVNLNTSNYLGTLNGDQTKLIPLESLADYDTVEIDWFDSNNIASATNVNLNTISPTPALLKVWGTSLTSTGAGVSSSDMPPIMRAEIIQYDKSAGFTAADFNNNVSSGTGANTLFLYPARGNASTTYTTVNLNIDRRLSTNNTSGSLINVVCSPTLSAAKTYACRARIKLPRVATDTNKFATYLNLTSLYNKANFQVLLINSDDLTSTPVLFRGVQPEIDSTGRANDLFKRVKTRVELSDINFAYPEAAVDVTNGFCKDFSITDSVADYNHLSSDSSNVGRCN